MPAVSHLNLDLYKNWHLQNRAFVLTSVFSDHNQRSNFTIITLLVFLAPSSLLGGGFTLIACMEPSFIFFLLLAEAGVCDKQPLISINKPLMGHEAYQHLLSGAGLYFCWTLWVCLICETRRADPFLSVCKCDASLNLHLYMCWMVSLAIFRLSINLFSRPAVMLHPHISASSVLLLLNWSMHLVQSCQPFLSGISRGQGWNITSGPSCLTDAIVYK